MYFKDKVVVITGAGKGIGKSVAKAYASMGAMTVIAEVDNTTGEKTEQEITEGHNLAKFIRTDLELPTDIINLAKQVHGLYGRLDILVNNAGISFRKSPYDLGVDEWDRVINTNLRGMFLCAREAARIMKMNGGGAIINIASTRAFMSESGSEAYAASKGGVVALTHALAASLSPDNIRVNCISPGWIETGDYSRLSEEDHKQHFSGRVGKPDDIARACLFLTGDGNDFISGANLIIDGGMTRKMIYEP